MDKIRLTTKDDDYPIIHRVLTIPGGCLGFLNHQVAIMVSMVVGPHSLIPQRPTLRTLPEVFSQRVYPWKNGWQRKTIRLSAFPFWDGMLNFVFFGLLGGVSNHWLIFFSHLGSCGNTKVQGILDFQLSRLAEANATGGLFHGEAIKCQTVGKSSSCRVFLFKIKNPTESWVESDVVFILNCWFYLVSFLWSLCGGKSGDDFPVISIFCGKTLKKLCKSRDGFCTKRFCMLWESEVHDARGHGTILRLGNYLRICVNVGKWWDGYGWLGKSSQAEMVGISNSFADSYRRKPLFMTLDVMIVNEKNEGAWCMDVHAYSFKILTHLKTNMLLMEEIRHHTGCIKP